MPTVYADTVDFRKEISLDYPGNVSDPVLLPAAFPITVAIDCLDGAIGRVETTVSSPQAIADDTAVWVSWPSGDVDSHVEDILLSPVTAARLNYTGSVNGELRMTLIGNGAQ